MTSAQIPLWVIVSTFDTPTAGKAKKEMAKIEKHAATSFPAVVCGTLSP